MSEGEFYIWLCYGIFFVSMTASFGLLILHRRRLRTLEKVLG